MINRVVIFSKNLKYNSVFRFANDFTDPYYILGVDKTADIADIKKAFYKLANEYHPDKIGDSQ
jgi:DnaJ-class molecular chaperone